MTNQLTKGKHSDFAIDSFMSWVVCLSAGLFFFYEFIQLNFFDVINQQLRESFHLDAEQLSLMSSTFFLGNILFLLPAGILIDRFSVKSAVVSALLICTLGTIGFSWTESYYWASFFHFLAGIGNAFAFLSCVVLSSRWFSHKYQAFVIGVLVTLAFLGGMIAHAPLAYLCTQVGWRYAILGDGILGVVLVIWIACILKDYPNHHLKTLHTTKNSLPKLLLKALGNRQNWLSGIYTSTMNIPIMVMGALWGGSYLMTTQQLTTISASHVVSFLFLGCMFGCPIMGWISDKLRLRKVPMLIAAVITLLVIMPMFLDSVISELSLCIIFFLLGFFTSAQVIGYPCIAESNPLDSTGVATSIASILIMGGSGVAQILFGKLIQYHAGLNQQVYSSSDFHAALWLFPIVIAIAFFSVCMMYETFGGNE